MYGPDPPCGPRVRGRGATTPWSASATPATRSHSGPEPYEWAVTRATTLPLLVCDLASDMVLKRAERASLPTYFYHSLPEHDASSDVRHVALNTAFDAYAKSECIAGGVPWSRVRPQPCSSWPPREAQTRLDSVRDQPPQSRPLVVAIESDRAETRSERGPSTVRCRELPRDREGRRRPSL